MRSEEIRTKFVRYFQTQGHLQLPSASLVVQGDPSVLLTSAGMQPFKHYYVDSSQAPAPRVVTIQRCLRARGLDDDTTAVGDDTHHTFFEMLGNFAFRDREAGGYFKKEAIAFGYEVVTRQYGLPPAQVWATTWAGEPGVPADDEAITLWQQVGVPPARIRPLNKKLDGSRENFWGPTGDSGPCGPCSEIHVDALGRCPLGATDEDCGPGHECGRFVEVWNLVFNQYYQERDRTLRPLAQTGIDTGSGFERVVALLAGAKSAYETDLFAPLIRDATMLLDAPYGEDSDLTRSLRIIVDHARAVTFMVGDGILPASDGRGYVARRLLRRAVRYGRQLGYSGPFMGRLAGATIDRMAVHYPHLREKQAVIEQLVANEEARFSETLSAGLELAGAAFDRLERSGDKVLPGATAFQLYDTFGFPLELIQEVAADRGFAVDEHGFSAELEQSRGRSRAGARFTTMAELDLPSVAVEFQGYERLAVDNARLAFLREGGQRVERAEASAAEVWAVLDRTPFYAERGGQVGDSGWLIGPHGRMEIRSTEAPVGDVIVHVGHIAQGRLDVGDLVRAEVAEPQRRATMRHHTATHLLHAALRQALGPHVHQAGSLVAPDRIRFDFAHGQPLSSEQRHDVQRWVNDAIRRNLTVQTDIMPVEAALRSGAVALFDEKYGEKVRVLTIGDASGDVGDAGGDAGGEVSKELCGGTHVVRTGEIGAFVLLGESSIGSGLRRVEAVAGAAAEDFLTRQMDTVEEMARTLGVPRDELPKRVAQVAADLAEARRRLDQAERRLAQLGLVDVLARARDVATPAGSFKLLAAEIGEATAPTMERLREVADWLRDKLGGPAVVLLASTVAGRPQLLAVVSQDLAAHGLNARKLLNEVAQVTGGRSGGRPELAQGGGGDPAKVALGLARGSEAAIAQASGTAGPAAGVG